MTTPAALLAVALRGGVITLDALRARVQAKLFDDAWGLAPLLDDGALAGFEDALRAAGKPLHAVRREWLRRGAIARAWGDGGFDAALFDDALATIPAADQPPWRAGARAALTRLLADDDAETRTRLAVAKLAIGELPAAARAEALATLRAGYQADLDDGAYEELDLAYGDLDPTLELARAYLVAGEATAAEALLADREARWPSYFNHEEQVDTIRATRAAPPAARAGLHARFLRWAVGTEPEAEWAGLYEARWWLEGPLPDAVTPDAPLAALIASATMAEAVAAIATSPRTPAAVRAPAAARLLELAAGYVATLREVTAGGAVSDWGRHATAIRQLRAAATALAAPGVRERVAADRLAACARDWSAWLITQDVSGDSLPHVYTAIAWAQLDRAAVAPACAHVAALRHGGLPLIVSYPGWDALLPPDEAIAVARAALHR
ncbi:MAG: hypothetical protein IPH80_06125 [Myxococcales bacterium]|nr:hypothetical protein [Myxococcales bacterium]MBP6846582.1 hypothetical protein [Kofleriaceae bacterium]